MITGSMDKSAKIWDLEKGQNIFSINKHNGEVISKSFNSDGDKLLTGSFDYTAKIFDVYNGEEFLNLNED